MTPILAHQGGWDEMLVAAGLVMAILAFSRFRRRRSEGAAPPRERPHDVCAYCGAALQPDEVRCPSCGFQRTEPPSAPSSD
jgi:hypothetical protein